MNLEIETTNYFLYHQIEDEDGTEIARFGAGKPTRTIISGTHQIRYTSTRLQGLELVNLPEPLYQEHIRLGILVPGCCQEHIKLGILQW